MKWVCCVLVSLLFNTSAYCWSKQGHLVIADITYSKLLPEKRQKLDKLLAILNQGQGLSAIQHASTWADELRYKNINTYNRWHYIRLPIMDKSLKFLPYIPKPNVLTASIAQVKKIQNPESSAEQKASALRLLIHFIGDLHQPLHVATKVNNKFPKGDLNGLKYSLKSRYKNLHRFWDVGGGMLAFKKNKVFNREKLVHSLKNQYLIKESLLNTPPQDAIKNWVNNAFDIALNDVYQQPFKAKITSQYRKSTKKNSRQQLVLAGYHLAQVLNSIL